MQKYILGLSWYLSHSLPFCSTEASVSVHQLSRAHLMTRMLDHAQRLVINGHQRRGSELATFQPDHTTKGTASQSASLPELPFTSTCNDEQSYQFHEIICRGRSPEEFTEWLDRFIIPTKTWVPRPSVESGGACGARITKS